MSRHLEVFQEPQRIASPFSLFRSRAARLVGPALIVLALAVHLFVVWTIAREPLDVSGQPGESQRSIIWSLFNDSVHRPGPGADLLAVYHAGLALQHGSSLYADTAVDEGFVYFPFRYLPVVGWALGGFLIQFPPLLAYRIWVLVLEGALGSFLLVFGLRSSGWLRYVGICVLLLSAPYFLEVYMGQFTFLTVGLVLIGLLLQEGPPARKAGAIWANTATYVTAVLLKLFPIVTAPAFIRKKQYWLPLCLAILLGLAVSLPYFLAQPGELRLFYSKNFGYGGGLDSGNYSLVYLAYLCAKSFEPNMLVAHWDVVASLWRVLILGLTSLAVFFNRRNQVAVGSTVGGVIPVGTRLVWVVSVETGLG